MAASLPLLVTAGGQLLSGFENWWSGRGARERQQRVNRFADPILQGIASQQPGEAWNVGQDAVLQMLRSDPWSSSTTALQSIIDQGGAPFDTSELFRSLGVLDAQARNDAVAAVQASASGLGQRFGTANAREVGDVVRQLTDAAAARNAQIASGSWEAAQGRRLGAAEALSQAGTQGAASIAQLLGALTQGQMAMNDQRLQAIGLMGGLPAPQGSNFGFGQTLGDLGSAMMMQQLLTRNRQPATRGPGFWPPPSRR